VAHHLYQTFGLPALVAITLIAPQAAKASFSINLTNQTGTSPTRSFSDIPNNLSITFRPSSASPQAHVASSATGLCLYANSADSTGRCGVNGTAASPSTYNFVQMTTSRNIYFTGGFLQQAQGASNPIGISYSTSGPIIASTSNTSGSSFSFSPLLVTPTQPVFFVGSGSNTSTRFGSFTFEEVPGPLPILGIAVAFRASRRIRKMLKSVN
jgi:hypothetical protein